MPSDFTTELILSLIEDAGMPDTRFKNVYRWVGDLMGHAENMEGGVQALGEDLAIRFIAWADYIGDPAEALDALGDLVDNALESYKAKAVEAEAKAQEKTMRAVTTKVTLIVHFSPGNARGFTLNLGGSWRYTDAGDGVERLIINSGDRGNRIEIPVSSYDWVEVRIEDLR